MNCVQNITMKHTRDRQVDNDETIPDGTKYKLTSIHSMQ